MPISATQNAAPGVTESIGVLKKIVQRAEQDYKREGVGGSNAVSATEVARAQSEYEISVERLKQGERALRFYRAQVEMAEARISSASEATNARLRCHRADLRRQSWSSKWPERSWRNLRSRSIRNSPQRAQRTRRQITGGSEAAELYVESTLCYLCYLLFHRFSASLCSLCLCGELIVSQDFFGRVFAAGAQHAAAGVAGRAAQVQAADRRAMVGPAGDGAEAEELVRRSSRLA